MRSNLPSMQRQSLMAPSEYPTSNLECSTAQHEGKPAACFTISICDTLATLQQPSAATIKGCARWTHWEVKVIFHTSTTPSRPQLIIWSRELLVRASTAP